MMRPQRPVHAVEAANEEGAGQKAARRGHWWRRRARQSSQPVHKSKSGIRGSAVSQRRPAKGRPRNALQPANRHEDDAVSGGTSGQLSAG